MNLCMRRATKIGTRRMASCLRAGAERMGDGIRFNVNSTYQAGKHGFHQ